MKPEAGRAKRKKEKVSTPVPCPLPTSAWQDALTHIRRESDAAADQKFRSVLEQRLSAKLRPLPSGEQLLHKFAIAIAYSQGAQSRSVTGLIALPVFGQAFCRFQPTRLAAASPAKIRERYWSRLSCIRFRGKIDAIVKCAKVLVQIEIEFGSFPNYLNQFSIPRRIKSQIDVDLFWAGFDRLLSDLKRRQMPFFRSTTSLLQLLLDLDYDSVKPDLIVMRLARRIGMVEKGMGDRHFRATVRALQEFSTVSGVRAAAWDWYLLAFGGQTDAASYLKKRFCPGPGACENTNCPVGRQNLCSDYNATQ